MSVEEIKQRIDNLHEKMIGLVKRNRFANNKNNARINNEAIGEIREEILRLHNQRVELENKK